MSKEVGAGGRFDIFLDSANWSRAPHQQFSLASPLIVKRSRLRQKLQGTSETVTKLLLQACTNASQLDTHDGYYNMFVS